MSGGGTTNTTTSSSAPPAAYINAFQDVFNQAQNVAQTPYSPYQGNIVAGFSPDQTAAMQQVEGITANGGIQAPYLQAAQQSITNAQTPLWPNVQQFSPQTMSQYESPYTQQVVNATENQFNNQNAIQQQGVVGNAVAQGGWGGDRSAVAQALTAGQQQANEAPTIAGLENQGYSQALQEFNQQQGTQLGANEANAWLGSQAGALESGLGTTAQQTALTNANALQGVGGMQQQYGQELLNVPYEQNLAAQAYPFQTTGWLANIGEGLGNASGGTSSTTSPGPSVVSQAIGLGTAGVGAYNAINNGSSSGGSYTAPSSSYYTPSVGSSAGDSLASYYDSTGQRGGRVGEDGIGSVPASRAPGGSVPDVSLSILPGQFGMSASPISTPSDPGSIVPGAGPASHGTPDILKNYGTTSTSTTSGGESTLGSILQGAGQIAAGIYGGPAGAAAAGALNSQVHFNHGGMVPARRDVGGSANASWENPLLEENLDNQIATMLTASGMAKGGALKRAMGGMSMSDESPWWERSAEREATDRHGLLTSSVAGRTDHLPISPAAGSYVVPADVVSGLGEGNTLAGANIMQRILDTGPHGIRMPVSAHSHMGPPRPPPVYREGMGDDGMATGGAVQHRATGGANLSPTFDANGQWAPIQVPTSQSATPVQTGPASPANTLGSNLPAQARAAQGPMTGANGQALMTNGQPFPQNPASAMSSGKLALPNASSPATLSNAPTQQGMGTGINASTGKGKSNTGIPALDAYLNGIESQTVFNQPPAQAAPAAPAAAATNTSSVASNSALSPYESAYLASITNNPAYTGAQQGIPDSTGGGGMKRGGMVPRRADGGETPDLDLDVDSTPIEMPPQPGPSIPGGIYAASAQPGTSAAPQESAPRHAVPTERRGSYMPPPPQLAAYVQDAAARHGVDPKPLAWLLSQESHWNPQAYNPESHTMGLGQFKAATAKEVGIDPWNPQQAIDGSAAYLRKMLDKTGGDYEQAIGRYGTFSTWHGKDADNSVRNQYRAFMGAKRGGSIGHFADGGSPVGDYLGSAADTADVPIDVVPVPSKPLHGPSWLAGLGRSLATSGSSAISDFINRPSGAQVRRDTARLANQSAADAMPPPPAAPGVTRQAASDSSITRSPPDPSIGSGILPGDKAATRTTSGGPPPPPAASDDPAFIGNSSDVPSTPTPHHDTNQPATDEDGSPLKPSPWEALMAAGFAMAAGKSPHALENIGAGGLAGVKDYQQQKQLAIQDQMRIDQAKTNALWRAKQGDLGDRKADTADTRAAAYTTGQDALAQYRYAQANNLPITDDLRRQAIAVQQQNANTRTQAMTGARDDRERALIEHATESDLAKATSISNAHLAAGSPMSVPDALKIIQGARPTPAPGRSAPAATTPAVGASLLPMPTSRADLVAGKAYNTGRGPATWDGTQFIPLSQ